MLSTISENGATSASVALAARVLGLEVMEILADIDSSFCSLFLFADDNVINQFPDLVVGFRPSISPASEFTSALCRKASMSPSSMVWQSVLNTESTNEPEVGWTSASFQVEYGLPLKTAMCYKLDSTLQYDIYICGFSREQMAFNASTTKFLSGVGYAIGVAIFDLDDSDENRLAKNKDLDVKEFLPRLVSSNGLASSNCLSGMESHSNLKAKAEPPKGIDLQGFVTSKSFTDLLQKQDEGSCGYFLCEEDTTSNDLEEEFTNDAPTCFLKDACPPVLSPVGADGLSSRDPVEGFVSQSNSDDGFTFPLLRLPVVSKCPSDLRLTDIRGLRHLADGSNSNIYSGIYNSETVIVKVLMDSAVRDPIAQLEFDMEYSVLCRLNHPNIIRVLGSGQEPRKFIVLEYLAGGSLTAKQAPASSSRGLNQRLFGRSTFDLRTLLSKARDIASALDYLHSHVHPEATFIHRDLKPDNIGFTRDGALKVFDFGLCACVKRRASPDDVYEMSGNTGSLRYMAPEVAMRTSYSEKADVYSFAIVVWQMARDKLAYRDLSRKEFHDRVVTHGERPKLDRSWPPQFSNLLEDCWHKDHHKRPSFGSILESLDKLIEKEMGHNKLSFRRSVKSVTPAGSTQSSWF